MKFRQSLNVKLQVQCSVVNTVNLSGALPCLSQWIKDSNFEAFIEVLKNSLKSKDPQTSFLAERSLCLCFLWTAKYHTSRGQFVLASKSGLYDTILWLLFRDIEEAFGTRNSGTDGTEVTLNVTLNEESVKFLNAFIEWCDSLEFTRYERTIRRMPSLIEKDLEALRSKVREFESSVTPIKSAVATTIETTAELKQAVS